MEVKTQTQKAKGVEKLFLFREDEVITKHLKHAENTLEELNLFILNAERVMRYKFSNDEKQQLLQNGENFIKGKIKEWSPFPNSSEDFNLEAMGMDEVKNIYQTYQNKSRVWQSFNFELNDKNFFHLPAKEVKKIEDRLTYYTENQAQVTALKIAETICKGLNDAINIKQVLEMNFTNIVRITNLVTTGANKTNGQREAHPNVKYIYTLN